MEFELVGRKENKMGHATGRLKRCEKVLNKYNICFPPFRFGTINIELDKEFITPQMTDKIILIQKEEIFIADQETPVNEYWMLIPVVEINGIKIPGYIYRTETNYWGNQWVELIARDLSNIIDLSDSARIRLTVCY